MTGRRPALRVSVLQIGKARALGDQARPFGRIVVDYLDHKQPRCTALSLRQVDALRHSVADA